MVDGTIEEFLNDAGRSGAVCNRLELIDDTYQPVPRFIQYVISFYMPRPIY